MIYMGIIILILTGLQLLIAALNYFLRIDYSQYSTGDSELVSIIIPARNEENNISNILKDLKTIDYQNIEIIVVDDESDDTTGEKVIETAHEDDRIHLIRSGLYDKAWLGKNHACYWGAKNAKGKYLLFLDADVRVGKHFLNHLLGYLRKSKVSFLSVFPRQLMPEKSLYQVVPLMNYILLSLLPLYLVRHSRFPSLSAANGQCMLFDAETYSRFQPHKKFRMEKVEDIHIARFFKKKKNKIACLTGNDDISCTMYATYEDAMQGFSKNVVAFFGNSFLLAWLFWFISFAGIFLIATTLPLSALLLYVFMLILIRIFISKVSRQSIRQNIQLHYNQLYNLGKLIIYSWKNKKNKSYQWKGRKISS